MEDFRRFVEDCNLVDLDCSGYLFTVDNGRVGNANVQCRLDRFLANNDWKKYLSRCSCY